MSKTVSVQQEASNQESEKNHDHAVFKHIAKDFKLKTQQIEELTQLLDERTPLAYIASYLKDQTGNLGENKIISIRSKIAKYRNVEKRRYEIIESIKGQNKLTGDLEKKLKQAHTLKRLEDIFFSFRPSRKTRGKKAIDQGLLPLADYILAGTGDLDALNKKAEEFVKSDKGVVSAEKALAGARDILAEKVNENAECRRYVREVLNREGKLHASKVDAGPGKSAEKNFSLQAYQNFVQPVRKVHPHQTLAIHRGKREMSLNVKIEGYTSEIVSHLQTLFIQDCTSSACQDQQATAVASAYTRLIHPAIENEILTDLQERAENHAIDVFGQNLKALLLQAPIQKQAVIGIDAHAKQEWRFAAIKEDGELIETGSIHPGKETDQAEKEKMLALLEAQSISTFVIGHGRNLHQAEIWISELISKNTDKNIKYIVVSDVGANAYASSRVGKEELPKLETKQRTAVSIARRALDPLSELVKIDPKNLGVGMYQHDVPSARLGEQLHDLVESAVNFVGVDINQASVSLLRYVAGLNKLLANNCLKYRKEKGHINTLQELKEIPGFTDKVIEQCSGFLRISKGNKPMDATPIHPSDYDAVQKLLESIGFSPNDLLDTSKQSGLRQRLVEVSPSELEKDLGIGQHRLRDILRCLKNPSKDARSDFPAPVFKSKVLQMEDVYEGMIIKGSVRNVVDFGAFVDIGLIEDGLIHVSELTDSYIRDPHEVVKIGDQLTVQVKKIDPDKGRISLSLKITKDRPVFEALDKTGAKATSRPRSENKSESKKKTSGYMPPELKSFGGRQSFKKDGDKGKQGSGERERGEGSFRGGKRKGNKKEETFSSTKTTVAFNPFGGLRATLGMEAEKKEEKPVQKKEKKKEKKEKKKEIVEKTPAPVAEVKSEAAQKPEETKVEKTTEPSTGEKSGE